MLLKQLEHIEYRRGLLERGADPSRLPVHLWRGKNIPPDITRSVHQEDLESLGGVYGQREAGDPIEYDCVKVVFAGQVVEITVYNRAIALIGLPDERIKRIHRVLCKLEDEIRKGGDERRLPLVRAEKREKIGRNDPCPCGSGKKYKKCCLDREPPIPEPSAAAQEVFQELRGEIADREFKSRAELQVFTDSIMEKRNRTGRAEFAGLSPEQMHRFLYAPFSSPDVVSFADELPALPEAPATKLFTLLVEAIGQDGLKATAKGNLPRKFCREAASSYWGEEKYAEWTRYGGINREIDIFDLHVIRIVAGMARLIRKYKGRFLLTRKARAGIQKSAGARAYLDLFRAYIETFNWSYRDGFPDIAIVQQSFLYTLYLLHCYGREFRPPEFYQQKFIEAFPMSIDEAPAVLYETPAETVGHCYALRSLDRFTAFFGLAEEKVLGDDLLTRKYEIRKTPLLDALVTFHV
jgi:hypothetical protein